MRRLALAGVCAALAGCAAFWQEKPTTENPAPAVVEYASVCSARNATVNTLTALVNLKLLDERPLIFEAADQAVQATAEACSRERILAVVHDPKLANTVAINSIRNATAKMISVQAAAAISPDDPAIKDQLAAEIAALVAGGFNVVELVKG